MPYIRQVGSRRVYYRCILSTVGLVQNRTVILYLLSSILRTIDPKVKIKRGQYTSYIPVPKVVVQYLMFYLVYQIRVRVSELLKRINTILENPQRTSTTLKTLTILIQDFLEHILLRITGRTVYYVDTIALLIQQLYTDNFYICNTIHVCIFCNVSTELYV